MQQFPREQNCFSEPVRTGGNNLPSNSDLGLKARGQLNGRGEGGEESSFCHKFPPASLSSKLFCTCTKPNRRREAMRTSYEIQLYPLQLPSAPPNSAHSVSRRLESTARGKALQFTHPLCDTTHCLKCISYEPQGFLYSQNENRDFHFLLFKLTG